MKRLATAKAEQSRLMMEVDREEEFISNHLQRKLLAVRCTFIFLLLGDIL